MKKVISLFTITCLLFAMTSCRKIVDKTSIISGRLGVPVEGGHVEVDTDTHGGCNGDGETYAEITFSDESFFDEIKSNSEWSELPLTETLNHFVYGGLDSKGRYRFPAVEDENHKSIIPPISNGYYFFKDRHPNCTDEKDDSQIFDRYSFNFTLAIYDSNSKTLYFYEIDT